MMIFTRAVNFPLTPATRERVEARIASAAEHVDGRVLIVTARLEDVDADRGGVDKWCRLIAGLRGSGVVTAEATDGDLYAAVDRAADRLRGAVLEAVGRQRARDRRTRRPALSLAGGA